jgi:phospholipase C
MDDPIRHVVILMLENHSFDQMLGCLKEKNPEIDGVDISHAQPHSTTDYPDVTHLIAQLHTDERFLDPDPKHEYPNVLRQLNVKYGFVCDYIQSHPSCSLEKKAEVMGVYPLGFLPVLHRLAPAFLTCDRWFSSLPGPTWPNRFFVHSGTCKGHVAMPSGIFDKNWHCYDQPTLYTRLHERGISWKIYHHGMPQSMVMIRQLEFATHYHSMETFVADASGPADVFPQFSFIEPAYSGTDQNDQHPPSDVMKGELLLLRVYNVLRGNEELWKSTLFIFLYDEHGGFYDHVEPEPTIAPDNDVSEFKFNMLGIRVPAVLMSSWVDPGVCHTVFDHTALLKYLTEKWGLGPLGRRTAEWAKSFAPELTKRAAPREDTPPVLDETIVPNVQDVHAKHANDLQAAMVSFSHVLEEELQKVEGVAATGERSLRLLLGVEAQFEVAKERIAHFIEHKKAGKL